MTLRPAARVYLWLVAMAAAALQVWLAWAEWVARADWLRGEPWLRGQVDLVLVALLVALGALAQHFPLEAGPRRKVDTSVAVYLADVLLFGAALGTAVVGVTQLLGQGTLALRRDDTTGARRRTVRTVVFNTGQMMLAAGAAGGIAIVGNAAEWSEPAVVLGAAAALYVVNSWSVALMVALQRGENALRVWLAGRRADLLQYVALFAVGVSAALLAPRSPWAVLLMAAPAAIVHVSLQQVLAALRREREAREAADRALEVRDEFISIAAHELKNPLAGLLGYTQLLLRDARRDRLPAPAELRDSMETIGQQARKLERMIGLLLDSKRAETGKLTLDRRATDVVEVVNEVVRAARVGAEEVPFVVRGPRSAVAEVDALRLEQVLANLVDNALKYGREDQPIEIDVGLERERGVDGDARRLRIAVRDHGVGIAEEHRERVFDRLYQAHGDGHLAGLGLGLYVCRCIVEAHGGWIGVECPPDGGTRFVIELPAAEEAETDLVPSSVGGISVKKSWEACADAA
ncbi:MAG TPA: HAMP domain-containing sensor histidine kinase [Chloroflexota bacterium]|nr:HAMP domain-containing sensor histidine kinase [Chloroflexota bacterium]